MIGKKKKLQCKTATRDFFNCQLNRQLFSGFIDFPVWSINCVIVEENGGR